MPEQPQDDHQAAPAAAPPGAASPEAILKAVIERHAFSQTDARKSPRHYYCVPITVEIPATHPGGARKLRAATNNISTGGFAFIADAFIRPGTLINVRFDSLPGAPRARGIVRSANYLCGTQHRVGVEFTGDGAPAARE